MNTIIYAINKQTKEHLVVPAGKSKKFGPEWDFTNADDDGWIPWSGGECPMPESSSFEAMRRDGEIPALVNTWKHWGSDRDIIAYRPILDEDDEPEAPKDGVLRRALLRSSKVVGPDAPEWNGEGLPPVGCVVKPLFDGEAIEVKCHGIGGKFCGKSLEDGTIGIFHHGDVEPYRSAEDRAVEEMCSIIAEHTLLKSYANGVPDAARALYRAGF